MHLYFKVSIWMLASVAVSTSTAVSAAALLPGYNTKITLPDITEGGFDFLRMASTAISDNRDIAFYATQTEQVTTSTPSRTRRWSYNPQTGSGSFTYSVDSDDLIRPDVMTPNGEIIVWPAPYKLVKNDGSQVDIPGFTSGTRIADRNSTGVFAGWKTFGTPYFEATVFDGSSNFSIHNQGEASSSAFLDITDTGLGVGYVIDSPSCCRNAPVETMDGFFWSENSGMVRLQSLNTQEIYQERANSVSDDGIVYGAGALNSQDDRRPVRWVVGDLTDPSAISGVAPEMLNLGPDYVTGAAIRELDSGVILGGAQRQNNDILEVVLWDDIDAAPVPLADRIDPDLLGGKIIAQASLNSLGDIAARLTNPDGTNQEIALFINEFADISLDFQNFGPVLVGHSAVEDITIENTGGDNSTLSGAVSADTVGPFTNDSEAFDLAGGELASIPVTYAPASRTGDASESQGIALTLDSLSDPDVTISGTGVAPQRQIAIDTDDDGSADRTVAAGATAETVTLYTRRGSGEPASAAVTLSNQGDGFALEMAQDDIGGDLASVDGIQDGRALHATASQQSNGPAQPTISNLGAVALAKDSVGGSGQQAQAFDIELSDAVAGDVDGQLVLDLHNGSGDGTNSAETVTIALDGAVVTPAFEVVSGAPNNVVDFGGALSDVAPSIAEFTIKNDSDADPATVGNLADLTLLGVDFGGDPLATAFDLQIDKTPNDGSADFMALSGAVLAPQETALLRLSLDPSLLPPDTDIFAIDFDILTDQGVALGQIGGQSFAFSASGGFAVPAPAAALLIIPGVAIIAVRQNARRSLHPQAFRRG